MKDAGILLLVISAVIHGAEPLSSQNAADLTPFNFFDLDLIKSFSHVTPGNWVSSPASIKSALALLLEGAAGSTAEELCQILRLPVDVAKARELMHNFQLRLKRPQRQVGVEVNVANRIASSKLVPVKKEYSARALQHYGAEAKEYDFSNPTNVCNEVNSWIREQTNNYITEVIQPSDVKLDSQVFIINAVYFKGEWRTGFSPDSTRDGYFFITPEIWKKTKMMSTSGVFRSGQIEKLNAQALELPYMDPRYSLVILLPNEHISLKRVCSDLPYANIFTALDHLHEQEMDVIMPKFTMTFRIALIPLLQQLGLHEIFSDNANLSDLVKAKAKVTDIIHEAKIEVNENGTVAGAASVVKVQLLSISNRKRFVVNRPFFFILRDRESGILFNGRVMDPDSQAPPAELKIQKQNWHQGSSWTNS